jgi:hypothetical protein
MRHWSSSSAYAGSAADGSGISGGAAAAAILEASPSPVSNCNWDKFRAFLCCRWVLWDVGRRVYINRWMETQWVMIFIICELGKGDYVNLSRMGLFYVMMPLVWWIIVKSVWFAQYSPLTYYSLTHSSNFWDDLYYSPLFRNISLLDS